MPSVRLHPLGGGGETLDLLSVAASLYTGFEEINLAGPGNNNLILDELSLQNITDGENAGNLLEEEGHAAPVEEARGSPRQLGHAEQPQGDGAEHAAHQVDRDGPHGVVDLAGVEKRNRKANDAAREGGLSF